MKRLLISGVALAVAAACGALAMMVAQQGFAVGSQSAGSAVVAATGAERGRTTSPSPKVVLHVNQNDAAIMNLALNNAQNVASHYKAAGQPVIIEVVAYGPGLHMLRADTSPIKARLASFALEQPEIRFSACENTQINMSKAEGKPVPLLSDAKVVPSGVVRLIELQQQGYAYVKP